MYLSHFGLSEPPFRITPHTDFFFSGANRGATLDALLYAITHDEGIVKVTGEVGSGKTMLCRVLMGRLPANVETIYLANPSLSREEILFAISDELQLELSAELNTRLLRALQEHLIRLFESGRRVVLLIDEAHAMPRETLEEIRLLSNLETDRHKLLQIVLFGQPELDEHLGSADMRQLKERITHSFRLGPMLLSDIDSYIDFRMRAAGYRGPNLFTPKAIRLIASASKGLTRRVNILSDKALLAAFAGNTHAVTDKEAKAAIRDSDFFKAPLRRGRLWLGIATIAGMIVGGGLHWVFSIGQPVNQEVRAYSRNEGVHHRGDLDSGPTPSVSGAPGEKIGVVPTQVQPEPISQSVSPVAKGPQPAPSAEILDTATRKSPDAKSALLPAIKQAEITATPSHFERTPPSGKLTRERFDATQNWLSTAQPKAYSIQLITVKYNEINRLEDFLNKAAKVVPVSDLHVYSVKINDAQHYRAAYGTFPTLAEVRSAMESLPQLLASQAPFYRTVERMQSQNRQ